MMLDSSGRAAATIK